MKKNDEIFLSALNARAQAYAPYSDHPVGAVIIDDMENIHQGCNVETAHFKGICAEGSAISAMIMAGGKMIRDVYVIGPDLRVLCTPCGDCRQRIREFSHSDTRIHCFGENGEIVKSFTIDELLPVSFGPENLQKT